MSKAEELLQWAEKSAEAKAAVFDYVEVFYNSQRLNSGVGYRTPTEARVAMSAEAVMPIAA